MIIEETLHQRLSRAAIADISTVCTGNNEAKATLFSMINHSDDRVAYNALWAFSHLPAADLKWLASRRDILIDSLLATQHVGRQRLLLTLLENIPDTAEVTRTDYLDFCLSNINSTAPYAIRALCLKQSFAVCRHFPELLSELQHEMDMMQYGELSPGLLSALRNVRKKISRLSQARSK